MKVASITVTYNDYHKFSKWISYYSDYKSDIYLHVIVDNASTQEYTGIVKKAFPDSIILHRETNGGVTAAYNEGIKYIIKNSDADAILLIDADIKLEKNAISEMYNVIQNEKGCGFVAPILLKKNSDIVENYGCKITEDLSYKHMYAGIPINDISEEQLTVDGVPGGLNMASPKLYQDIGLEDERLFMYSDELDMALRVHKIGYHNVVTKKAIAWHQHENVKGQTRRLPYMNYLIPRNTIYIAKKHYGIKKARKIWAKLFFLNTGILIGKIIRFRFNEMIYPKYGVIGCIDGIIGRMDNIKYTTPENMWNVDLSKTDK